MTGATKEPTWGLTPHGDVFDEQKVRTATVPLPLPAALCRGQREDRIPSPDASDRSKCRPVRTMALPVLGEIRTRLWLARK
jgi:hypothetical protein